MVPADHPARQFAPFLQDLAEGRVSLDDWLNWWERQAAEAERALLPGWFSRLRPSRLERSTNETMAAAIAAASYILTAMGIEHTPDNRYLEAANAEHQAAMAEIQRKHKERETAFLPAIAAIGAVYPKFARLLKRRTDLIIELQPGATDEKLATEERLLGLSLPEKLKTLLRASRQIQLEGFDLGHLFFHEQRGKVPGASHGMLCFADYFLEADGDQMLLDPRDLPADDPPVYYYAHAVPEVRPLAQSFSAWLESLGRSPLFRE